MTRNDALIMDLYDDIDDMDYPLPVHGASTVDLTTGVADTTGRTDSCSSADTFLPNYGPDHSSVSTMDGMSATLPRPRSAANPVTHPTQQHHTISSQLSAPSALCTTELKVHNDFSSKQENFLSVPRMKFRTEVTAAATVGESDDNPTWIGEDNKCSVIDSDVTKCRLNQRRAVRNERRYHTADTIEDINKKDNSVQKRLSWNYGSKSVHVEGDGEGTKEGNKGATLSVDSLRSVLSSSGVSSTASLHLSPEERDEMCEGNQHMTDAVDLSQNDIGGVGVGRSDRKSDRWKVNNVETQTNINFNDGAFCLVEPDLTGEDYDISSFRFPTKLRPQSKSLPDFTNVLSISGANDKTLVSRRNESWSSTVGMEQSCELSEVGEGLAPQSSGQQRRRLSTTQRHRLMNKELILSTATLEPS